MYTTILQQRLTGERALFQGKKLRIEDCVFDDGESPLKEAAELKISGTLFRWKYPLWYCTDVEMTDCTLFEMARAGLWYTRDLTAERMTVDAPKTFRRCENIVLRDVNFSRAEETLWHCRNVRMENCTVRGDYFAMDSEELVIDGLQLTGGYAFDGVKNVTIRNARMLTKDAFWNAEDVVVEDSFISAEYLGWNSKRLTLINCTIESLQGLCYAEDLLLRGCRLLNTSLAFEFSTVDAEVLSGIDSVKNPISGTIRARQIGELILEEDQVDPSATEIITL